ncbi:MAG: stalk domain-containing protein, partial [Candidatus Margulisiibacteriota bacterium]
MIKTKIEYIPLRTLVEYFDGTMIRSKKDYVYIVKIKEKEFIFKENSNEYTSNSKKKVFKHKTLRHRTRLYVPLNQLLSELGFTVLKHKENFYATPVDSASTPEAAQTSTKKVIKTDIVFDYKKSRLSNDIKTIYLPISKKSIPLKIIYKKGKQYTSINEFLTFLGYKLTFIEDNILLKKNNLVYSFKHNQTTVKVSKNKNVYTHTINHVPLLIKSNFYVELQPFLNDLGFDYKYSKNKIIILKKLHSIKVTKDNTVLIQKNSKIKLTNGTPLGNPNRLFWDLKFTKCPNKDAILNGNSISKITFGQRETTCRMVWHVNQNYTTILDKVNQTNSQITLLSKVQPHPPKIAKSKTITS